VAIIDLVLPDGDGSDLVAELRAVNPSAQALVLSANVDRSAAARAVEKAAAGVLSKIAYLQEVVGAVGRVLAGETLIPLDELVELLRFAGRERERELDERRLIETLTAREREILQLLADGLDGPAMAARLYISPRTQRNHVADILGKLSVHSQLQAVISACATGSWSCADRWGVCPSPRWCTRVGFAVADWVKPRGHERQGSHHHQPPA
jgi:DNA-binding NarL/FixJ family response regulator